MLKVVSVLPLFFILDHYHKPNLAARNSPPCPLLHHMQQAGVLVDFFAIMKRFWTTCNALYTTVRVAPHVDGFCRSWRFDFFLAQNYELLQSNNCLLGCESVMETRAVSFSLGLQYTYSAILSSLRNWANHDRCRLRPSTPAQLCWSSSRLQHLQNNNLIKFAIIRPSTLNHDRNFWNCRGAPDETTCLTGFFRCTSALALTCMKLFNVCANKLSLLTVGLFASKYTALNREWNITGKKAVRMHKTLKH